MKTTSISKLKSSLSLFLDIIKKGEEVIIIDREHCLTNSGLIKDRSIKVLYPWINN